MRRYEGKRTTGTLPGIVVAVAVLAIVALASTSRSLAADDTAKTQGALDFRPVFELHLDESVEGEANGEKIEGRLGPGATFVPSVEGQGVAPGEEGPAVVVPLPTALWTPEGTLAFRFRPSRTLRGSAENGSTVLVRCPLFTLTLVERADQVRLLAKLAHDGSVKDQTTLQRFALGKVEWSRLDANKWYHLAISWDANFPENRLEAYLNGASQTEMRLGRAWWHPWILPKEREGNLEMGGVLGVGERSASIAIDSVQLFSRFMYEEDVAVTLKGRPNFALSGEGRWDYHESLNLDPYKLSLLYETEFDKALSWTREDDLFDGDKRMRLPEGKDWVLESNGKSRVWTEGSRCVVLANRSHSVLWNTRVFPESFLLEFGMSPKNSRNGLTIVFFAVRGLDGGSIFDPDLPRRAGKFKAYTHGGIKAFHCSYWATVQGILRRTSNVRKNPGFHMPVVGIDRIGGRGPGPHRVRVLKVGNKIQIETCGKLAVGFEDDGETYGPALKDGYIGLRQMAHAREVSYTHFRVWKVEPRD